MIALVLNIVIGLWVMVSPSVLPASTPMADSNHITGPLIMTFSVVALWEVNHSVAKANIPAGAWLLLSIIVFADVPWEVKLSNAVAGVAVILLSLVKRKRKTRYGGGWRSLFQPHPLHLEQAEKNGSATGDMRPKAPATGNEQQ